MQAHASVGSMQKVGKVPACCLETWSKEILDFVGRKLFF